MARKNDNAKPKPKVRRASSKGRPSKPTDKPGGKRPKTPADDDALVSRHSRVRSTSRGGRGR